MPLEKGIITWLLEGWKGCGGTLQGQELPSSFVWTLLMAMSGCSRSSLIPSMYSGGTSASRPGWVGASAIPPRS